MKLNDLQLMLAACLNSLDARTRESELIARLRELLRRLPPAVGDDGTSVPVAEFEPGAAARDEMMRFQDYLSLGMEHV